MSAMTFKRACERGRADLAIRAEICRVAALWQLARAEPWKFCTKPDCAADPCLRCQAKAAETVLKAAIVSQAGEAGAAAILDDARNAGRL